MLQRIVTKREQDSAMHAVHRQNNPEDVFPKVGHKSQCPMPVLEMRNGIKPMVKKYVLKSLIMEHLPAEREFLSYVRVFKSKHFYSFKCLLTMNHDHALLIVKLGS